MSARGKPDALLRLQGGMGGQKDFLFDVTALLSSYWNVNPFGRTWFRSINLNLDWKVESGLQWRHPTV